VDYLKRHAALSDHEIDAEVDRYVAWPGQALAYKLGEMQIRRHRRDIIADGGSADRTRGAELFAV
jgi:uncharacterized protein (DUF885 family)